MKYDFFATSGRGLEDLVAAELRQMGIDAKALRGGVRFSGSLEDGYRATLWSRLASTVLLSLGSFRADTEAAVYRGVQRISWDSHLDVDSTFAVSCTATRATLTNTHFVSLKVKDAIVDQFRHATQARPSVDVKSPNLALQLHLDGEMGTLYLDLGNPGLHKRGYRVLSTDAPLRETVAASILIRANWPTLAKEGAAFLDPMCGSGTLVLEAAMIAADMAPGLGRTDAGFGRWLQHDRKLWKSLMDEATSRRDAGLKSIVPIHGSDVAGPAIAAARRNVEAAGLLEYVTIERCSLKEVKPPANFGLVATNPPYGVRFEEDAAAVHRELGDALIARFEGWQAAIITESKELGQELGMRATRVFNVDNGPLRCLQLNFEITPERVYRERRLNSHD